MLLGDRQRDDALAGVSRATRRPWSISGDPVGKPFGFFHEVGHEDDRDAMVADASMSSQVSRRACGIEPGGQLVEDGDPGITDEREGDRQALLLAARQLRRRRPCACRRGPNLRATAGFRRIVIERGVQVESLRRPGAGPAARSPGAGYRRDDEVRRGRACGSSPSTRIVPESGLPETADGFHGRCLAGAVRAEDGEDLAFVDREGDVVDRDGFCQTA